MIKEAHNRAGQDLLESVSGLVEKADRDGRACRVFFAGRSAKSGVIPTSDLIVILFKPGTKRREYSRFTKAWPNEFKVAGKITKNPRYLCSALAGVHDSVLFVGTDEVRWSPVKPGCERKPMACNLEGCTCGCTRHDLHERDLRKVGALNPVRMVRHRLILMLGRSAYDPKICGEELEIQDQLVLPNFMSSVSLPYQRFQLRSDASDCVDRAERFIKATIEGHQGVEKDGASMLLRVLRHANEGNWLNDWATEKAPYTGLFRLGDRGESVYGYPEAPYGYEEDVADVEGTKCIPKPTEYENPSKAISDLLEKFFEGDHHVRFEPTVGKEWTPLREGQALWLPKGTPRKNWAPAELAAHSNYKELCHLAALATVETRGRLAYADLDLTVGSATWVDLDSAPRVQLVSGLAGLAHYSNGIRCNLTRLDIEAHIRATRASRKRLKASV